MNLFSAERDNVIVVGSFQTQERAEVYLKRVKTSMSKKRQIRALKSELGFKYKLRQSGDVYVVIIHPFKTLRDVRRVLRQVKRKYTDAYIHRFKPSTLIGIAETETAILPRTRVDEIPVVEEIRVEKEIVPKEVLIPAQIEAVKKTDVDVYSKSDKAQKLEKSDDTLEVAVEKKSPVSDIPEEKHLFSPLIYISAVAAVLLILFIMLKRKRRKRHKKELPELQDIYVKEPIKHASPKRKKHSENIFKMDLKKRAGSSSEEVILIK